VFNGPYRNAGKWAREMEAYVADQGHTMKKLIMLRGTSDRLESARVKRRPPKPGTKRVASHVDRPPHTPPGDTGTPRGPRSVHGIPVQ